ncbi:MAG: hypothetical protein ACJ8H8_35655, partial [Geminicoccaceae bacterium]
TMSDNLQQPVLLDGKPVGFAIRPAKFAGVGYEVVNSRGGIYRGVYPDPQRAIAAAIEIAKREQAEAALHPAIRAARDIVDAMEEAVDEVQDRLTELRHELLETLSQYVGDDGTEMSVTCIGVDWSRSLLEEAEREIDAPDEDRDDEGEEEEAD